MIQIKNKGMFGSNLKISNKKLKEYKVNMNDLDTPGIHG